MINPKQNFIEIILGPIINFFETKLILLGGFFGVIFITFVAIPIFRTKNKTDMDVLRKVLIIIAIGIGFIFSIIDTFRIRDTINFS